MTDKGQGNRMVRETRSRPANFLLWLGLPLGLMGILLIVDVSPLDFAIENLFYDPVTGFIGRKSWFLENFLHDRVKQAIIALGAAIVLGFVVSLFPAFL